MKEEKQLLEIYNKMVDYQQKLHVRNQKRIKIGIRCIYIIPAVFLVLLFLTNSSKIIFLVLWIVSLFLIAVYLIYVEYADYKIQEQLNIIEGNEGKTPDSLIDLTPVEERVAVAVERMEEARGGKSE
jgi:Ca2+/Na+ antiporter